MERKGVDLLASDSRLKLAKGTKYKSADELLAGLRAAVKSLGGDFDSLMFDKWTVWIPSKAEAYETESTWISAKVISSFLKSNKEVTANLWIPEGSGRRDNYGKPKLSLYLAGEYRERPSAKKYRSL